MSEFLALTREERERREREIFAQLSIFRGGFTRQAAQTITGASLRVLGTLTSKSHLQFDKDRNRYQIHELLRQYGAEKLRWAEKLAASASAQSQQE